MSKIINVDESNFEEEVLNSKGIVILEYSSSWCGPCVKQLPILEKFASENENVKVFKLDVDESKSIASRYGVKSIPTIMLFKDGKRLETKVGLTSAKILSDLLDKAI